jgi:hypothetical protein
MVNIALLAYDQGRAASSQKALLSDLGGDCFAVDTIELKLPGR